MLKGIGAAAGRAGQGRRAGEEGDVHRGGLAGFAKRGNLVEQTSRRLHSLEDSVLFLVDAKVHDRC